MKEREFDYINVIPFVDIMLVLLTIVLTTSTFIATGVIPVELPKAAKSRSEALKTQIIEINGEGSVFFEQQSVTLENLKNALQTISKETPLLIRADRNIRLQTFVDVLDIVKNLEFKRVNLETEERR